jgi:hypothetical protein
MTQTSDHDADRTGADPQTSPPPPAPTCPWCPATAATMKRLLEHMASWHPDACREVALCPPIAGGVW